MRDDQIELGHKRVIRQIARLSWVVLATCTFAAGAAKGAQALPTVPVTGTLIGDDLSFDVRSVAADSHTSDAQTGTRLHLPTLAPILASTGVPSGECTAEISIISLGPEPSQAIIARFAPAVEGGCATCAGPTAIECTGLLRPGRAWRLALAPGEAIGSAAIFSLSAAPLERIVSGGGPAPIASVVCAALQAAIADGDFDPPSRCAAWAAFEAAWASGGTYVDVPLELAVGALIGGEVKAICPDGISAMRAIASIHTDSQVVIPRLESADSVIVQNAGSECTTVRLITRALGACGTLLNCRTLNLAPGEARTIAARACGPFGAGGASSPGSGLVASLGPVAVALVRSDGTGARLIGGPAVAVGRVAAPLAFDPEQGWTINVDVTTFKDLPGDVSVTVDFLDREGESVSRTERRLCAGSASTFQRAATTALPGLWVGSVHVSAVHLEEIDAPSPARIAATVRLTHAADAGPGEEPGAGGASAAYPLSAIDEVGVGLLGIPALNKRDGDETGDEVSSAIGLANLADAGNETEYALLVFDPSGLVDTVCGTLGGRRVEYIEMDRWASIPAGFRGSAVISATRWRHTGEASAIPPVRLAAVVPHWAGAVAGDDRLSLSPAIEMALGSEIANAFAGTLPPLPCEPGVPVPGTTATNTPSPVPTRTPRPPVEATSTPGVSGLIWLPLAQRGWVLREPTATATPSRTPVLTTTATPTPDSTRPQPTVRPIPTDFVTSTSTRPPGPTSTVTLPSP